MKKAFSAILVLAMLAGFCLLPASAAGTGTLNVTSASGYRGDTVSVDVNLTSNPGLITMKFQVSYSSNLTLVSVSNSGLLNGWTTPAPTVSSPYTLRWADSLAASNNTATGKLVTLTFKINDNAAIGAETISILFNESRDVNGAKNTFSGTAATIKVNCKHSYGSWSKLSDAQHERSCTVCGKKEAASHSWDAGKVTKPATCKEQGIKTFTCSVCKGTKTEAVAKTNDHIYSSWSKLSDAQHERSCTVCGKKETASHSWDAGKVTKPATCKEEGIKTFTCTGCKHTKTETVSKTTTHTYGSWSKLSDAQHERSCTVCGKKEAASHSWDAGKVTKPATCKEKGVKLYTCTGCSATRTESIPKTTVHTWDHGCDTDCNICGLTRTTEHTFQTTWNKDQANHWHTCSECGEKKDTESHKPGVEATESTAQTCTTCGYVIRPALGHIHSYADTWTTDENGHWCVCTGCEGKSSYAEHDFENTCDSDCSICGYTRETNHTYAEEWANDKTYHWHMCTGCGLKADEAAHEPGVEATAATAQTCTICNYEIAPALGVETTEPTDAPEDMTTIGIDDPAKGDFPWWILLLGAAAAAVAVAIVIIKRKK